MKTGTVRGRNRESDSGRIEAIMAGVDKKPVGT
jgi:hypothetical protein